MLPHGDKLCSHGHELKHESELNMNSNYRHLLSSYDQTNDGVNTKRSSVMSSPHAALLTSRRIIRYKDHKNYSYMPCSTEYYH